MNLVVPLTPRAAADSLGRMNKRPANGTLTRRSRAAYASLAAALHVAVVASPASAIQQPNFPGRYMDDRSIDFCYHSSVSGTASNNDLLRGGLSLSIGFIAAVTDLENLGSETCDANTDIRAERVALSGTLLAEWVCLSPSSGTCNRGVIKYDSGRAYESAKWQAISCHETMHAIGFGHYAGTESNSTRSTADKTCLLTPDILEISAAEMSVINAHY